MSRPAQRPRLPRDLEGAYARALEEYLAGGGEEVLRRAYEIGRRALADGRSLLEVVAMHHACLGAALHAAGSPPAAHRKLDRARAILAECISPYEMAQRGFVDAIRALRRLNETLEGEIQRLAHDVHDQAGQLLVAARLALSSLAREAPDAREGVVRVSDILDRAEQELRRISHELRPLVLDDLGLLPAIQLLAEGLSGRGLAVAIDGHLRGRPGPRTETAAYRVVQEALTNVARHARARNVSIRLARDGDRLVCQVRDDGVGFDDGAVRRGGLGLLGIRERLHALGGTLQIRGGPGRGAELHFHLPWEA